jgi:hypothetical protein
MMKTINLSPGLRREIKFQQILALAGSALNSHETEAAELAARRWMEMHNIDPVLISDQSFYNHMNFADNALLKKLRDEWREQHPNYAYRTSKDGIVRRLRRPRRAKRAAPDPVKLYEGLFDDFDAP